MKDEKYITHKSWGLIGFSRVHGVGKKLFGSDVATDDAIIMTLKQAEKTRDLNRTWVHSKDEIAEVIMTPNQFAELITLMNVGEGVPCTIRFTQKDGFIDFKPEDDKIDLILEEREKHIDNAFNGLNESIAQVYHLMDNKKISKTVGTEIVEKLTGILNEINGKGRAFINHQAKQEIEKMVVEAKQNIQSYVDYKIYSTGLNELQDKARKMLNKGE